MKSLYDISLKISEKEYRAMDAFSYSTVARFQKEGVAGLRNLFDKISSPSLTFGSMVDALVTEGEEAFNNRFYVANYDKVSTAVDNMCKYIVEKGKYDEETVIEALELYSWNPTWRLETRIRVFKESATKYLKHLFASKGKEVVSVEDYENAKACYDALMENPITGYFFGNYDDGLERLYQLKFDGNYEKIKIRCMMDEVIINHATKKIIPIDLKTTKNVVTFNHSFYEYRYFIQAGMYSYILQQNLSKDDYFKDFVIEPYHFICVDRVNKYPVVFRYIPVSNLSYEGVNYENWWDTLKKLYWHIEHSDVILPKDDHEEYMKNGFVDIKHD